MVGSYYNTMYRRSTQHVIQYFHDTFYDKYIIIIIINGESRRSDE